MGGVMVTCLWLHLPVAMHTKTCHHNTKQSKRTQARLHTVTHMAKKIINFKMRKKSTTINTRIIVKMSQRTMDKTEEVFLQNISRYSISLTKSSKFNKKNEPKKKKKKKKKKS